MTHSYYSAHRLVGKILGPGEKININIFIASFKKTILGAFNGGRTPHYFFINLKTVKIWNVGRMLNLYEMTADVGISLKVLS